VKATIWPRLDYKQCELLKKEIVMLTTSSKEPAVQATQFDQQRDDDNQKRGMIHPTKLQPGDENDEQSRSLKSCESLLESVLMHIKETSSTLP
jgi:hypothetical protein